MDEYNNMNGYNGEDQNTPTVVPDQMNGDYQQPYEQMDPMNGQQPDGGKGMSVASMVLGIIAIVGSCCCTYVGIICGIIAVVLGIISKKQQREGSQQALAGIICGCIGTVVGIVTMIINIVSMKNGTNTFQNLLDQLQSSGLFM